MNFSRMLAVLGFAFAAAGCTAGSGPEPIGEANQKLIGDVTAGHYSGWSASQDTLLYDSCQQYYNSLQVDSVNGYSFSVTVTADFDDYLGYSWTQGNQDLCKAQYMTVDLEKLLGGSWVQWNNVGQVSAVPSETGFQIGQCRATFTQAFTPFSSSTSLNAYVSGQDSRSGNYACLKVTVTEQ